MRIPWIFHGSIGEVGWFIGRTWWRRIPFVQQEFFFPKGVSLPITRRFSFERLSRSSLGSSSWALIRVVHREEESRGSKIDLERGLSSLLGDVLGQIQALFQEDGREIWREVVHADALCGWQLFNYYLLAF